MEWIAILFTLILLVGTLLSLVIWSLKNGISPMPTSTKVKKSLLLLLPKALQGKIYDLGSGWGTLLFPLARQYPHCQVIGFETSPLPFFVSLFWLKMTKQSNVCVIKHDFFAENLNQASLIVCYLYPEAMKKLKSKFEAELKPETFVITHTFAVPGWTAEKILDSADLYHNKIYLYRMAQVLKKTEQENSQNKSR